MYTCIYLFIRVGHSDLALALWPSLICCVSSLINPLLILHFGWNVGPYLRGCHNSHLVPRSTGPGDKILNKLWPHNHMGYVWLIQPLLSTFYMTRAEGQQRSATWRHGLCHFRIPPYPLMLTYYPRHCPCITWPSSPLLMSRKDTRPETQSIRLLSRVQTLTSQRRISTRNSVSTLNVWLVRVRLPASQAVTGIGRLRHVWLFIFFYVSVHY
jgi:hypothetical protein